MVALSASVSSSNPDQTDNSKTEMRWQSHFLVASLLPRGRLAGSFRRAFFRAGSF